MIFFSDIDVLEPRRGSMEAATMTTGPNDAKCVVWALGESFFLIFVFFYC
jgi:hypothetical protein